MYLPGPRPADATPEAAAAARRSIHADVAEVDHAGRLSARFGGRDHPYLVRRMVVTGPPASWVRVYVGDPDPLTLADGTAFGSFDVNDYAQPLYVPQGYDLVILWTDKAGGNVAGTATARVEIEDMT